MTDIAEENAKIAPGSMQGEKRLHFIYCLRRTVGCTANDIARYIKNEFDTQHSQGWTCVVARGSFGCMYRYQNKIKINDYGREKLTILLFR